MAELTFDKNGYPTEDTLLVIKHWSANDPKGWLEFVNRAWDQLAGSILHNPEKMFVEFVTGGWSGNESLIAAMRGNYVLWAQLWESSHRGGRHVFRVPE